MKNNKIRIDGKALKKAIIKKYGSVTEACRVAMHSSCWISREMSTGYLYNAKVPVIRDTWGIPDYVYIIPENIEEQSADTVVRERDAIKFGCKSGIRLFIKDKQDSRALIELMKVAVREVQSE